MSKQAVVFRILPVFFVSAVVMRAAEPVSAPVVAAKPGAGATAVPAGGEKPVAEPLKEMTVTATRSPLAAAAAPYTVRELGAQTLEERLVRTMPEALRELPGVSVQKTSNGQGSPFIRGLTGFRNLALIDGIRYNNSTFRDGPNQYWALIDPYGLDRIELVPGQGSVLYGSDSMGGTLNVLTKGSGFRDEEAGKMFVHGSGFYRWASAERSHTGRVEINTGRGGDWGLHIGATVRDFGDVQAAGIGRQPKTGYGEWAYDVRFDAALTDQWTFTAAHQQARQNDVWRTHSTVFGVPWAGTTIGSDLRRSFDQERTLTYARVSGETPGGLVDSTAFTVSWQTNDELQDRVRSSGQRDLGEVNLETLGFDLQMGKKTPFGTLTWGADYYRDSVDSSTTNRPVGGPTVRAIQGPVGDDSTYGLFGIYLQDQIDVADRLHVYVGTRYTRADADIGRYQDPVTKQASSFSDDWDQWVASGRFVFDLDDKDRFAVIGGVSQGFRAPNISDLSRLDIARSGELELPSTDLSPERSLNFEIGARATTERVTASLTYFHNVLDDFIVRKPTGQDVDGAVAVSKANGGNGYVQGVEVAANVSLTDNWSVFGQLTWMEGELDQYPTSASVLATEPLSRVVPLMGRAGVRWQSDSGKLWSELVCLAASAGDRLSTGDKADTQRIPVGGTPGWTLLLLRGGWQVTENVSLTASLENLLDEDYRAHGSGSNEPGFGGTAALTVRF